MNTGKEKREGAGGGKLKKRVSECEKKREEWRGMRRETVIWSQTAGLGQAKASSNIQYITDNTHSLTHTDTPPTVS